MNRKNRPLITVGTSCLLLIFLSLCLLTLGILALASARTDLRLSEKIAERTSSYYEAEARASLLLAGLRQELSSRAYGTEEILDASAKYLAQETEAVQVLEGELCFRIPAGEGQQLSVTLRPSEPSSFTVTSWKSETSREWSPDTHQDVYQPGKDSHI